MPRRTNQCMGWRDGGGACRANRINETMFCRHHQPQQAAITENGTVDRDMAIAYQLMHADESHGSAVRDAKGRPPPPPRPVRDAKRPPPPPPRERSVQCSACKKRQYTRCSNRTRTGQFCSSHKTEKSRAGSSPCKDEPGFQEAQVASVLAAIALSKDAGVQIDIDEKEKLPAKRQCRACRADGERCSKTAKEGEIYCHVHLSSRSRVSPCKGETWEDTVLENNIRTIYEQLVSEGMSTGQAVEEAILRSEEILHRQGAAYDSLVSR